MDHPDFRVGGKIFATLGYPDAGCAMVKLSPIDQDLFIQADPEAFVPVKGAWGKGGRNERSAEQGNEDAGEEGARERPRVGALARLAREALGLRPSGGR